MNSVTNKQLHKNGPTWPDAADHEVFQSACAQSHSAVQWLARLANSFQVPASDGSHLHMSWADEACAVRTNEIAPGTDVEMRLPELELQFREHGTPTKHIMALDDKSPAEAEAWSLIELLHRGIDRDKYSKALPYDVTGLLSGDARHYQTLNLEAGFAELAGWLQAAAATLADVASAKSKQPVAVRFAPEHFSVFVRVHPGGDRPAVGNYIEAGFCAGDTKAGEPYFYALTKPGSATAEKLMVSQIRKDRLDFGDIAAFLAIESRLEALAV
ncbi:MAG: hypothetical protein OER56_03645 [Hyphomicrobiales bacterium]|nr:hypothetical protein [Hyphomicrobiales bacterium]